MNCLDMVCVIIIYFLSITDNLILNNMIINVASSTRFHLCTLASELEKCGHTVRFYTFLPTNRLQKYGLKKECSASLFWLMAPVILCRKLSHYSVWSMKLEWFVLDYVVGLFMKPCDVFIGSSSIYSFAFRKAKKRFNAITILERGSIHALGIKALYDEQGIDRNNKNNKYYSLTSDYAINRELEMYEFVDYISIASSSVKNSFLKYGVNNEKLFVNPYGVELSMFPPTKLSEDDKIFDVIMVGNWGWMKGCDLLIDACRRMGVSLIHVGGKNMEFPDDENFLDIGPVPQGRVTEYFKKAKVFVLPSRQEGLALVQLQAVSSGLPVVCSEFTGGTTIRDMLTDKQWIDEFSPFTVEALCKSIAKQLALSKSQKGVRIYEPDLNIKFSSLAYGKRYSVFLNSLK